MHPTGIFAWRRYAAKLRERIEADRVHIINVQTAELELAARAGSVERHRDSDANHAVGDLMDENDDLTIQLNSSVAEVASLKVYVSELQQQAKVMQVRHARPYSLVLAPAAVCVLGGGGPWD